MENLQIFFEDLRDWDGWGPILFWWKIVAGTYSIMCIIGLITIFVKKAGMVPKVVEQVKEAVSDMQYPEMPKSDIERRWGMVKQNLQSNNPLNLRSAIIDADNILDEVLQIAGFQGINLGERMKRINVGQVSNLESLWQARKLRNDFVHNVDYVPQPEEVGRAIAEYEKTLRELGALG